MMSLSAGFAFLQILLGIHGLEITLDDFENINCGKPGMVCRNAEVEFNITGRIILEKGEVMPPFIAYEHKCPQVPGCITYKGQGDVWEWRESIVAGECNWEKKDYGCKLISGRTYRYFIWGDYYYYFRFCTVRARLVDVEKPRDRLTPINAPGIKYVSNELKLSDYKDDSSYSSDLDEMFEKEDASIPCHYM
ncbi:unnamed protein product, partial [Lymnaea stagnalis]